MKGKSIRSLRSFHYFCKWVVIVIFQAPVTTTSRTEFCPAVVGRCSRGCPLLLFTHDGVEIVSLFSVGGNRLFLSTIPPIQTIPLNPPPLSIWCSFQRMVPGPVSTIIDFRGSGRFNKEDNLIIGQISPRTMTIYGDSNLEDHEDTNRGGGRWVGGKKTRRRWVILMMALVLLLLGFVILITGTRGLWFSSQAALLAGAQWADPLGCLPASWGAK